MKIIDPLFLAAITAIDTGNEKELTKQLTENPRLIHERVPNGEEGYFKDPYLLWFIAENPIRNNKLPENIVAITGLLIEFAKQQRVKDLQEQLDYTLALVCSGQVSREHGVQLDLIDFLVKQGANPDKAVDAAIVHEEVAAVEKLLHVGAKLTLLIAIALNKTEEVKQLKQSANEKGRQAALAVAALYGRAYVIASLIPLGINLNDFCPPGFHSHATPLHQAVWSNSLESVKILIEAGADRNIKDLIHQSTPLGWAEYGGKMTIGNYLRNLPS